MNDIPPELLHRLLSVRSEAELHQLLRAHPELASVLSQLARRMETSRRPLTLQSHPVYQLAAAVAQSQLSLEAALAQAQTLRGLSETDLQRMDAYIGDLAGQRLQEAHLLALINDAAAQTASPLTRFLCAYKVGMTHLRRREASQAAQALTRAVALAEEAGNEEGKANTLNSLGLAYNTLGQVNRAIACYQESIALSRQIGFRAGEGNALGNLGVAYYEQGYFEEAISYYRQALPISREIGDRGGEACDLGSLGNAYRDMGRYAEALTSFQEALAISRQIGDRWREGEILGNIGLTYYFADELEQAIEALEQGLTISRETGNRQDVSNILGNLGNAYRDLGQVERAIGYYQQALEDATELGYWRGVGYHLSNLGLAYNLLGQVRESISYYQRALEIGRQLGDRVGQSSRLGRIGCAYHKLGEVRQAIEYYQEALALARELDSQSDQTLCLSNLALASFDLREPAQAIDYYQQALALVQAAGDAQREGEVLCGLGSACCASGQLQEGIHHLEAALDIGRRQQEMHLQAVTLGNLSIAWYGQGHLDRALEYGSRAFQVCQTLEDQPLQGRVLVNLGRVYRDVGNLTQAVEYLQEGLHLLRRAGDELLSGRAHGHLGLAYHQAGVLDRAIEAYQQALEDARRRGDRLDEGVWFTLLGDALRVRGDREQALQTYQEALAINRQVANVEASCQSLYGLGLIYAYRDHNDERAAACFEEAIELAERWGRNMPGLELQLRQAADWGMLYQEMTLCALRQGRYRQAWAYTERQKARLLREWLAQVDALPGEVPTELAAEYWHLLNRAEKARLATRIAGLSAAFYTAALADDTGETLAGRARLDVGVAGEPPDDESLPALSVEMEQLVERIRQFVPGFEAPSPLEDWRPESLASLLPEKGGTALVTFNVTHRGSIAFILHREQVEPGESPPSADEWVPLPALSGPVGKPNLEVVSVPGFTREDLDWTLIKREREVALRAVVSEDYLRITEPQGRAVGGWLVDYYRFQNEQSGEARERWLVTMTETVHMLYEELLRPVVERLDALGIQCLILVPSLGLHLLPLHIASPKDAREHALLDDYEISYAPSALVWRHCQEREAKARGECLVAAANPTGDLHFAEYEVKSIQTQFPPEKRTIFWRDEADRESVLSQAEGAGYLHFACHGLFDLVDPLESQLSLADGDLTLREILGRLRLSCARAVVLSACETGVSEFRELADEAISLPAGFLMAGAPAVVASLWAVNDLSTALFMERFYRNLLTDQQNFPTALRAAQFWLRGVKAGELAARFDAERRKPDDERIMPYEQASVAWRRFVAMKPDKCPFAHPYYWAAFTFSGASV